MRAALTAAARNAADSGDADAADLRKLVKKQDQQKLALTIQTAKTAVSYTHLTLPTKA